MEDATLEVPSGNSTEPTVEQLQAILAQREQQAMRTCLNQLIELARSQGFEIAAFPHLNSDGRLSAHWGVRRIQG